MANYDLEKYKEILAKVNELQGYLFVTAKPIVDADYHMAMLEMAAHRPKKMDALAPDPFDPNLEMLHSIGRARGIAYQMLDFLGIELQTFIDLQQANTSPVKSAKKRKHRRY